MIKGGGLRHTHTLCVIMRICGIMIMLIYAELSRLID